ncbi:MAG TPA: hypothetical protein VNL37_06535 [Candidatus Polarisedimenticolia bacterium]|nr:hypothetical protein [Candidatus Polarisedimenticolia bacterium]
MFGAPARYQGPDKWEVSLSWRYQKSDRHFVGHVDQKQRTTEQSQVINRINQADLGITRNYDRGWRLTFSVPYLMATRSSPIRDASGVVFDRSTTQSHGMGDLTVVGRKWIWDPATAPRGNISLGFGIKLPTGQDNVTDTRKRYDTTTGTFTYDVETNDQSIQPGDGGFGLVFDVQMFRRTSGGRFAGYGLATYLVNPQAVSGVQTFRSAAGEDLMSISDVYLVETGVAWYPGRGWGLSLSGRAEGVPVYDLIGSSRGFRRPGYAISIEPGVSWTHGPHTISLQVPYAIDRARLKSVPDRENNRHGDAAFADYFFLAGYTRRF